MSLYIGKDTNTNQNKVVISNIVMSKEFLQTVNTLTDGVIFNSNLPYLEVDYIKTTNITSTVSTTLRTHVYTYSSEQASLVYNNGDRRIVKVFLDGIAVPCLSNGCEAFGATMGVWSYSFSDTGINIYTPKAYNGTEFTVLILPFTESGSYISNHTIGGTVYIGNGMFTIGNTNIFKLKFLIENILNTSDDTVSLFGTQYQVVNSTTPTNTNISISVSDSKTTILYGEKLVLSSEILYSPLVLNADIYTHAYSNYYRTSPLTGLTFLADAIYYISITYTATAISGNPSSTAHYITKANGQSLPNRLFVLPAANSKFCLFQLYFTVTTTSIEFTSKKIACTGGVSGPIENVYYGPYNVVVSYKRLT